MSASSDLLTPPRESAATPPATSVVGGLRAALTDQVDALGGGHERIRRSPLIIAAIGQQSGVVAIDASSRHRLRGALVASLTPVLLAGMTLTDPYAQALSAWRTSGPSPQLRARLGTLDDDERARLAADVAAHARTLADALATFEIPSRARIDVRCAVPLVGTPVVLLDHLDLVWTGAQGVHLLDVTTSPLGPRAASMRGFHALTHALATGRVARTSTTLSTATGEHVAEPVDAELLARATTAVCEQVATDLAGAGT